MIQKYDLLAYWRDRFPDLTSRATCRAISRSYPPSSGSRGMIHGEASIIEDHTERKENPHPDGSGGVSESAATRLFDVHCTIWRDRPSYKYRTAQPIGISRRSAIVLIHYPRLYNANPCPRVFINGYNWLPAPWGSSFCAPYSRWPSRNQPRMKTGRVPWTRWSIDPSPNVRRRATRSLAWNSRCSTCSTRSSARITSRQVSVMLVMLFQNNQHSFQISILVFSFYILFIKIKIL